MAHFVTGLYSIFYNVTVYNHLKHCEKKVGTNFASMVSPCVFWYIVMHEFCGTHEIMNPVSKCMGAVPDNGEHAQHV